MNSVAVIAGSDPATDYAKRVAAGEVVAGRLVRLACERHLRDLETGPARGLRWDPVEAAGAIAFWEMLPHLKGRNAKRGECLRLEPWQRFVVGSVYGWKRADGRRRFRVAWVELGRKNGKTTLVYPAALFGLAFDGEHGAEVYSVATKRDQARLVFDLAKRAVARVPELAEVIRPTAFALTHEETFSRFEAQSADADTLDGLSPHVAICDEVHKWRGRALWDVIETGVGAREQPLIWAITTAGEEGEEDVYGQEHAHCVQVLEGVLDDDSRFAFIACLDPGDDWTDPRNWVKANPNFGVSLDQSEIAEAVRKARNMPAAAAAVKRLRLGIRGQEADRWVPLPLWDSGRDPRAAWDRLKGFPCYAGLDLASESDFAALALAFPVSADWRPAADLQRPDLWAYLWRLWIPGEGLTYHRQRLRELVRPWVAAGHVLETPGDAIDHTAIESGVLEAAGAFDLRGLAYDPFNAAMLATRLQAEGVQVGKFPQSMAAFAEPTKAFEADLLNGAIRHDGNPAVRWMISNVVLVQNAAGHRMPSRKRSRQKIDAVVAAVMARGRAAVPEAAVGSYYDTKGVELA